MLALSSIVTRQTAVIDRWGIAEIYLRLSAAQIPEIQEMFFDRVEIERSSSFLMTQ